MKQYLSPSLVEKLHLLFFEVRLPNFSPERKFCSNWAPVSSSEPALVKRLALAGLDEIELTTM
jgi:hypothetical protein